MFGKEFAFGPTTHATLGDIDNLGMGSYMYPLIQLWDKICVLESYGTLLAFNALHDEGIRVHFEVQTQYLQNNDVFFQPNFLMKVVSVKFVYASTHPFLLLYLANAISSI